LRASGRAKRILSLPSGWPGPKLWRLKQLRRKTEAAHSPLYSLIQIFSSSPRSLSPHVYPVISTLRAGPPNELLQALRESSASSVPTQSRRSSAPVGASRRKSLYLERPESFPILRYYRTKKRGAGLLGPDI